MASIGRPTQYDPGFCELLLNYFEAAARAPARELEPVITEQTGGKTSSQKREVRRICAELPTLEGFAHAVGISSSTIRRWAKDHAEFGEAYALAKDIQFQLLVDRGLTRQYDPTAFIFVAKNITSMADKQVLAGRLETVSLSEIFSRMGPAELDTYAKTGVMPEWARALMGGTVTDGRQ